MTTLWLGQSLGHFFLYCHKNVLDSFLAFGQDIVQKSVQVKIYETGKGFVMDNAFDKVLRIVSKNCLGHFLGTLSWKMSREVSRTMCYSLAKDLSWTILLPILQKMISELSMPILLTFLKLLI